MSFKSAGPWARFLLCAIFLTGSCFAQTKVVTGTTVLTGVQTVPLGGPNGVASLDGTGNVPLAQLGNAPGSSAASIVTDVLFTPPSWATSFPNLQNASGNPGTWTACVGLPLTCGGGGEGTGTVTLGTASPSLSGAAMTITAANATYSAWSSSTTYAAGATVSYNGVNYYALLGSNTNQEPDTATSYWHTSAGFNALTYRHLGCSTLPGAVCTAITHFNYDIWFYIPSTDSGIQALEFDPDAFIGGYEYFISMQCDSATGDWKFWYMSAGTWTLQTASGGTLPIYPCKVLSETNAWHHLQLQGTISTANHTYAYQSFAIDGVPIFANLNNSYSAASYTGSDGINVEVQLDLTASATSDTVYYDQANLGVY